MKTKNKTRIISKITRVSILKTIYFNIKYLPFNQAIKFPIIIGRKTHVKISGDSNIIILDKMIKTGMITLFVGGSGDLYYFENRNSCLILNNGHIAFKGPANISFHTSILVSNGTLKIGNNFISNVGCKFSCVNNMVFGDNVIIGGNCVFRDSDGHEIEYEGSGKKRDDTVCVSDNCWITNECHILKGTYISKGSVVAYGSLCNKSYETDRCLIAGHPASIVKNNVRWKK